jgi:outer membrane protein OmpA-like peptidoglycan-associated protein/Tol biopolymer transport system component
MKKILYSIIICLSFNLAFGQDVPFDKKLFKETKSEFKEAQKHLEKGDEYLDFTPLRIIGVLSPAEKQGLNFAGALEEYLIAYKFNSKSADLNYKIGICYDNIDKYKMQEYIFNAYKLKPTVVPEIRFYMGVCHHLNGDWGKAISEYNAFGSVASNELMHVKIAATKKVMECRSGEKLSKKNARVWIDNVGSSINTKYPDYAPVISADEALMIFTARRPDEEMSPFGGYFEDLYSSKRVDGVWSNSQSLGKTVNVSGQHDATIGLSPDGHTLFVYNDDKGNGDILISTDENGVWSKPIRLGKNINTKEYHEPDASLSFDGRMLYFTSNKPGGYGGHDIYRSVWNEDKKMWGVAENLGDILNTAYDERSIFIHPDGKTMYFASKGHNTIGGYDLFYSKLENNVWQKPINFGTPLNSPHDDVQLVVAGSGRYGYYSSYKSGGFGEKDIYLITFLGPEKAPILSNEDNLIASIAEPIKEQFIEPEVISEGANMAILIGVVRDEKTKEPLKSSIVLIDNEENKVIAEFKSDDVTGKYLVSLPGGKNYGIAVKKEGYLFHSDNFVIPNESGFRQYEKNVDLKKIEIGQKIVLRNIFFDLSKWSLRNESVNELERLITLMNENPTMKIELSGHTDTRGGLEANRALSENRAKSVVEYLVDHGIEKGRLKFAGYGENQPIHSDSIIYEEKSRERREELHQENRRTEFKVISL